MTAPPGRRFLLTQFPPDDVLRRWHTTQQAVTFSSLADWMVRPLRSTTPGTGTEPIGQRSVRRLSRAPDTGQRWRTIQIEIERFYSADLTAPAVLQIPGNGTVQTGCPFLPLNLPPPATSRRWHSIHRRTRSSSLAVTTELHLQMKRGHGTEHRGLKSHRRQPLRSAVITGWFLTPCVESSFSFPDRMVQG